MQVPFFHSMIIVSYEEFPHRNRQKKLTCFNASFSSFQVGGDRKPEVTPANDIIFIVLLLTLEVFAVPSIA